MMLPVVKEREGERHRDRGRGEDSAECSESTDEAALHVAHASCVPVMAASCRPARRDGLRVWADEARMLRHRPARMPALMAPCKKLRCARQPSRRYYWMDSFASGKHSAARPIQQAPIQTMLPREEIDGPGASGAGQFNTTHWSVVLLAGETHAPQADVALEKLCRTYWPPLYAYVRRKGHSPHDAQDLTQEFFARLLEKEYLKLADPERGRFRSFLLKSLQHFLVNEWGRAQALKRGGGHQLVPLDDVAAERIYQAQPDDQLAPESFYDKRWAMTLLEQAMERLGTDYSLAGKQELFGHLKAHLLTEGSAETYRQLAGPLGLSEGAVKVAMHRLRQRFRDAVRAEVAQTVATPAEVDEELRCLMAAMGG